MPRSNDYNDLFKEAYMKYNEGGISKVLYATKKKILRELGSDVDNRPSTFSDLVLRRASQEVKWVDDLCYLLSVYHLRKHQTSEETLEDILSTINNYKGYGFCRTIQPMQIRVELISLSKLVRELEPETIMEIGTAQGGTLYILSRYITSAETVLSLDLPGGEFGGGYSTSKMRLFEQFSEEKELKFVRDNSHNPTTKEQVERILDGDTVDFLFIDGDHTYSGVKQDFQMYREFVSDDGVIALHDIVSHKSDRCEVDEFWNELQSEYETTEFIESNDQGWAGIGIVYL